MKKIILIVLISIFVVGCNNEDTKTKNLIDKNLSSLTTQEIVNKIKMGMSESDVVKLIGEPKMVTSISEQNGTTVLTKYDKSFFNEETYSYESFEFSFLNGKLFHYKIYRNKK